MPLSEQLVEKLACPQSKQPLIYFADEGFLLCPASKLKYRIEDDIPVLLVEEAESVDDATVATLVADAKARNLPNA